MVHQTSLTSLPIVAICFCFYEFGCVITSAFKVTTATQSFGNTSTTNLY